MAKRKSGSLTPAWLRHRGLLGAEAVLVVGVLQEFGSRAVQGATTFPNWGKVLFIMTMTLGLLGGLVLMLQGVVGKVIGKAYETAPVPYFLMHLGAFAGLFLLYSWAFSLPVLR
jgi:hypothetical protein